MTIEVSSKLDYVAQLEHEKAQREEWAASWHSLVEGIATILEVNPNNGRDKIAADIAAAIHKLRAQSEPHNTQADEIVTRLYRRFKEWAARGFGPEDVTWCEVKADIIAMIHAETKPSEPEGVRTALAVAKGVLQSVLNSYPGSESVTHALKLVTRALQTIDDSRQSHETREDRT